MNGANADGSFWDANELDLEDQLNHEIWKESRERQARIIADNVQEIDAQQAMAAQSESSLPWVPDVVGKDWKSKDAVMVVGSAYAGFISEFSERKGTMPLEVYRASVSHSPQMFQRKFVELVMQPDLTYYRRIQTLLQGIYTPRKVALFDLCRASFVKRIGEFEHTSGDGVVNLAPQRFEQYVLANADWTWERIDKTESSCIVALGTIAEHGILRLFADKKMVVCTGWKSRSPKSPGMWVKEYADLLRKLSYWHKTQTWWLVVDPCIKGRCWKILPVYHPCRCQAHDPDYQGARKALQSMKQAPCP